MLFFHCRQLHTTTNLLLLSLAVSDLLTGLMVMPGEIVLKRNCWFLGDIMCVLYYMFLCIIMSSSIVCIVLISVDRYVVICHPLHYSNKVTLRRVSICICLGWKYSLFVSVLLLHSNLKQPGSFNSCYGECVIQFPGNVDLVVNFLMPIIIITSLYVRVFIVAVSQARSMRSHIRTVPLHRSQIVVRSELKAARTLGVVVAVFVLCYTPYYCVSLKVDQVLFGSVTDFFLTFLLYLNSCLNPMIYAFLYPWFRKSVKLIITLQIMQLGSCDANIL